jgi:uncharacterized protein involved in outer membrane biogenesis
MRRRWLQFLVVLLAVLLAGSFGLSLALRGGWARRGLLARLSAGFGRPVEVGRLGFSLLSGLRLEAQSVTVDEDPRFGDEYFLRAERLTASVRWSALIQGRFEFDTVSLTRPSLNLVRLADGQWNIESWLPPLPAANAGAAGAPAAADPKPASTVAARLSRIEVQGGRINFKRDSRKLSLALVAVTGRFDHDSAGHWNIDVRANPMRAPASLQQAGTLRVRGVVGGVSTRLRPASLALSWADASLADLSRLAQGRDYGIRGTLNAELTARIDESPLPAPSWGEWAVEGSLRLQGVHGWALAGRAADPSANVNFQAKWRPAEYRLIISRCVVEAPQSQLAGTIDLDWSRGFHPHAQVVSSRVSLADLLAWRRAFRARVADDLAVEGAVDAQAKLSGWPARIDDLVLSSAGAVIRSPALPAAIRVGPVLAEWAGDTLKVGRTSLFLPLARPVASRVRGNRLPDPQPATSTLLVEGAIGPLSSINALPDARYRLVVSGSVPRTQDLLAVARVWDSSAASTWTAEGPVSLQLALVGSLRSGMFGANGTIQVRGVELTTAFLNRPLLLAAATVDLRGDQRRINLQSVQAIGGHWTGSLRSPSENGQWDFDLAADHLDAADFYAWMGSQGQPNLLERMLPFGAAGTSNESAGRARALADLRATGRLRVAKLVLSPLQIEKIDASAKIDGPSLVLRQARADLFGGQWSGNVEARLFPVPEYSFDGQFARLDLGDFAEAISLPGRASGMASGELKLAARGSDRAALAASLQGQGSLRARDAVLVTPAEGSAVGEAGSGIEGRPSGLTARFQVGAGSIRLDQMLLSRPSEQTEVTGTVDFARRLDLRIQSARRSPAAAAGEAGQRDSWTIAGTLEAPRATSESAPASISRGGVPSASASH